MKKLIYLSIIFLALLSCSSGDDNSQNNVDNSLLLRKWYLVSETSQGNTYLHKACGNGNRDYFEFIAPNIANFYHWISTNNCNYTSEPYTWTRNTSEVIKLNYGGDISTLTILELTATSFIYVETQKDGTSSKYVFSSF